MANTDQTRHSADCLVYSGRGCTCGAALPAAPTAGAGVERFTLTCQYTDEGYPVATMMQMPDGKFVAFAAYASLLALLDRYVAANNEAEADYAALLAEVAELRANDRRYQFLRFNRKPDTRTGEELDAAIDAALSRAQGDK